jgi:hypothetical protein
MSPRWLRAALVFDLMTGNAILRQQNNTLSTGKSGVGP